MRQSDKAGKSAKKYRKRLVACAKTRDKGGQKTRAKKVGECGILYRVGLRQNAHVTSMDWNVTTANCEGH